MAGTNAGTGCPISFHCSKCRRDRICGGCSTWDSTFQIPIHCKHKQGRTGRTKPAKGNRNARMSSVQVEYICECGHTGWSKHIDILGYPLWAELAKTYTIRMKDGPLECVIQGAPPCLFCGQPVEHPSSDGPLVCGPCDTVPATNAKRDHFVEEITRYRLERLNREMSVMSGGYEHHKDFKAICALGSFRPKYVFFRNLRDNVGNPWVLFQLLSAFFGAGNGPRIAEEDQGVFDKVRAAWLMYGREYLESP